MSIKALFLISFIIGTLNQNLSAQETKTSPETKAVVTEKLEPAKRVKSESKDSETKSVEPSSTKSVETKSVEPSSTNTVETKTAEKPKPDFILTQFIANDVNFRGISIYGEKLSRRNLNEYQSFSNAWLLSSTVAFQLPLTGLKFIFTANNPVLNRENKDSDQRLQIASGGEDQTQNLNNYLNGSRLKFDAAALKSRKEYNGLRDVFIAQMYYDWETKIGTMRTGFFFLNNHNYPTKFNFGEWVLGLKPAMLKVLSPEINVYYRFTSELGGITNGNIHIRPSIKHDFMKDSFFRITPSLEMGYQAANNNIDRRYGISDFTSKLQFFLGSFFVTLIGVHRPDLYIYDNDRNFTKTGQFSDINPNDGKTVDPSKTVGVQNQLVLNTINNSNTHEVVKQFATRNFQEQNIVQNIFIVNFGYTLKF